MNRTVTYALIAVIGVGAAALYGMQAMQGNDAGGQSAAACTADAATIKAAIGDLWMSKHLGNGQDRAAGDAKGIELGNPVTGCAGGQDGSS